MMTEIQFRITEFRGKQVRYSRLLVALFVQQKVFDGFCLCLLLNIALEF